MIIRVLEAHDAEAYQALRLKGLETNPEAFGSTYEREVGFSMEHVIERMTPTKNKFTLGAFIEDRLIAIVTFVRESNVKTEHKGNIFGMYVSSDSRGTGVGKKVLTELIKLAGQQEGLEQINLTVVTSNVPAKKMYESLGFNVFGTEKRALKFNGEYFDEDLMVFIYNKVF